MLRVFLIAGAVLLVATIAGYANIGAIVRHAMTPTGPFDPARAYVGSDWNGATTEARLNADTDRVATAGRQTAVPHRVTQPRIGARSAPDQRDHRPLAAPETARRGVRQLFFMNLRENATRRVRAFTRP